MGNLEDYINTLTKEEREQFENLINECLEREEKIVQASREREISLIKLEAAMVRCTKLFQKLKELAEETFQTTSDTYLRITSPGSNMLN